jgi:alkylation response protein AidB-like acyl-CoA dehydrogenase
MSIEFDWTGEQRALRAAVAGFASRSVTRDPGYDRGAWRRLGGELGAAGLTVDEELGGVGATALELGIVAEELGRVAYSTPFLATVGLAATGLSACGPDEQARAILRQTVSGERLSAVALSGASGRLDLGAPPLTARPDGDAWMVDGVSGYVLDGADADVVLGYARAPDGRPTLVAVDGSAEGLRRRPLGTLDSGRHQAELTFAGVRGTRVGQEADIFAALGRAVDVTTALIAAEQSGIAQAMLRIATDYASTRLQFGRRIGSFQAVKHRLADMYITTQNVTSTAYHALWAIAEGIDDVELATSLAQQVAANGAREVTASAIQVHGGIGFTWEHQAHWYFKRAVSNGELLGGRRFHASRLRAAVLGSSAPVEGAA